METSSRFHIAIFLLLIHVYGKYGEKKIGFHKTPSGWVGHRFMELFRKIYFF